MRLRCSLPVVLLLTARCLGSVASEPDTLLAKSPVGMATKIEQVVIPGRELVAKPIADRSPIVVRILETYPHGSDFRYDLEVIGLEPGEYQLTDYLQHKDGTELKDPPELAVLITGVLPEGQILPNALEHEEINGLGGYQRWIWIAVAAWLIGLVLLLFAGRGRKGLRLISDDRPQTLADRLQPMVEQAISGKMPAPMLAELEMMLVAFWRKKLQLEDRDAAAVIPELRRHEEAGPLLSQLEVWLHRPATGDEVNVEELLNPYRSLPSDALESLDPVNASAEAEAS